MKGRVSVFLHAFRRTCGLILTGPSHVLRRFSFSHLQNEIVILWLTAMHTGVVTSESERPVTPDRESVERELAAILQSAHFRGSRRCQGFLSYVVTKTLDGQTESLREREIATAVFGLKPDAHLEVNSIVRVGAREVRKRLAQYYVISGNRDGVWIELPPGSYVPVFQRHSDVGTLAPVVPAEPLVELLAPSRRFPKLLLVLAGVAVLAVGAFFLLRNTPGMSSEFSTFWRPVFESRGRLLIVLANPIVYHPSVRARALDEARNPRGENPYDQPLNVPPELLNGSDFVPVPDRYVGIGDCTALFRLGGLFESHVRSVRVRLASKIDFNDLRDSATVLIGAYTNRWSMELSHDLPLRFAVCGGKPCIAENAPSQKQWALTPLAATGVSNEDYILISRLPVSKTGGFVLIGAGITHSGTDEAGRILSDSSAFTPILQRLPKGWSNRNLQIVLYSKVVDTVPAPPQVVSFRVW